MLSCNYGYKFIGGSFLDDWSGVWIMSRIILFPVSMGGVQSFTLNLSSSFDCLLVWVLKNWLDKRASILENQNLMLNCWFWFLEALIYLNYRGGYVTNLKLEIILLVAACWSQWKLLKFVCFVCIVNCDQLWIY